MSGERKQRTLLPAAELLNLLLLVHNLGVERHADADARVVLDARRLLIRLIGAAALGLAAVGLALDDQPAVARGHELLKDSGKLLGHLLERALNGFVLGLVEMLNQLLD